MKLILKTLLVIVGFSVSSFVFAETPQFDTLFTSCGMPNSFLFNVNTNTPDIDEIKVARCMLLSEFKPKTTSIIDEALTKRVLELQKGLKISETGIIDIPTKTKINEGLSALIELQN